MADLPDPDPAKPEENTEDSLVPAKKSSSQSKLDPFNTLGKLLLKPEAKLDPVVELIQSALKANEFSLSLTRFSNEAIIDYCKQQIAGFCKLIEETDTPELTDAALNLRELLSNNAATRVAILPYVINSSIEHKFMTSEERTTLYKNLIKEAQELGFDKAASLLAFDIDSDRIKELNAFNDKLYEILIEKHGRIGDRALKPSSLAQAKAKTLRTYGGDCSGERSLMRFRLNTARHPDTLFVMPRASAIVQELKDPRACLIFIKAFGGYTVPSIAYVTAMAQTSSPEIRAVDMA